MSCDNKSLSEYSKNSYMRLPVYLCNVCGMYITGKNEDEIKKRCSEIYKKEYWDGRGAEEAIKTNYSDINSQGKKRQWISQFAYCKKYFKNKRFLEIGCGSGQTIFWFEEEGFDVSGIEPDERNVGLINQKLKSGHCEVGFAEEFSISGNYDIIWISHVFEHLVRPDLLLRKCKEHLNPNGILFIEVPNCENAEILKSSVFEQPSTFHFTKKSLMNLAIKANFKIERCDCFRSPSKLEGVLNKIMKKISYEYYPYYPKIITNNKDGTDIRIILKN
jgi:2-polyprenyl-3-methyl-5-hydroxy-6-metoxy-1,4-benzoquinol methylase